MKRKRLKRFKAGNVVQIRVTMEQRDDWFAAATAEVLTLSDWMRRTLDAKAQAAKNRKSA